MITEDYVSFETAKLLKEKGFNEYCMAFRSPSGALFRSSHDIKNFEDGKTIGGAIAVPTIQMAMKWLREVYNLFIQITVDFSDGAYPMYDVCVVNLAICNSIIINGYDRYSYKNAVETVVKYCLEKLI